MLLQSTVALLVLLTPIGIALSIIFRTKLQRIEVVVVTWLLGGSVTVISIWVWIYFRSGTIETVKQATLAIWIVSICASVFYVLGRSRTRVFRSQVVTCLAVMTSVVLVVAGFYIVPRTFDGQITQRRIMGPDAIGYANAVAALIEDGSFERLRSVAIASSGYNAEYELFDQDVRAVYMIPDKSLSIKAEFITGSFRVGFPGIVALVTEQLGLRHLLAVMNITAGLFLVIGAILIFGLMRSRHHSDLLSVIVAILSMTNINLLVGFHEGGVAQAFMFSATAAFLVASIQDDLSPNLRVFLYSAAYIQAISSYIDMLFVFLGVTVAWLVFAGVLRDRKSLDRVRLSIVGVCVSAIALTPQTLKLPRFLLRRFADARQGGWNWDSWTELTGVFGISNPYYDNSPDSIFAQIVLIALGVQVVWHLANKPKSNDPDQLKTYIAAVVAFAAVFYVYSRVIMDHTTYQWFKLMGTFVGPISIPLIALLFPWDAFKLQRSNLKLLLTAVSVGVLSLTVSYRFARFFFSESAYLSNSLISEIADDKVREITKQYQVFGHYGWQEVALTPFWPAQYLNRDDAGTRPIARVDLPVGLMVREPDCPQWKCLQDVPDANKIPVGSQYLIIDLDMTGSDVRLVPPYTQWIRVNRALAALNAPYVDGKWTNSGSKLRYKG